MGFKMKGFTGFKGDDKKKSKDTNPTYSNTDETRSVDEIRSDASGGKQPDNVKQDTDPTYMGTDEYRSVDQIRTDSEKGKKKKEDKKKNSPLTKGIIAAIPDEHIEKATAKAATRGKDFKTYQDY